MITCAENIGLYHILVCRMLFVIVIRKDVWPNLCISSTVNGSPGLDMPLKLYYVIKSKRTGHYEAWPLILSVIL